jgi:uncharacterized protein (DUF924 family)
LFLQAQTVLNFWFGSLKSETDFPQNKSSMWFVNGAEYDGIIRSHFLELHDQASKGELDEWCETPRSMLALVILLDQFSRHIYRNNQKSFSQDAKTVSIVKQGIEDQFDKDLYFIERKFLYMPLMHAEDIVVQDLAIEMFTKLRDEVPAELKQQYSTSLSFAQSHHYVISKFGRFPELNEILGRNSTQKEGEFLATGKYRFL